MKTNNYTQDDCTQIKGEFQLVLPINVEVLIPQDDSVRLLSQIVEELDLKDLMLAYSSIGRNPAVPPVIMLKILLYAYMQRVYSSREIEMRCRRDVNFKWLLSGYPAPDHNTIARFRTERLSGKIESLFKQLVLRLHSQGHLPFQNIFIDGTKIEANANKYSFVWKKTTAKNTANLSAKFKTLVSEINAEFCIQFEYDDHQNILFVAERLLSFLESQKRMSQIEFVYGRGRRKHPTQRYYERLVEILEKKEKYDHFMNIFGEDRNSFSKTDHDATFMHMKEDHMRNSQLKPGYNFQIGVENGYITGMDISSERNDVHTLKPFLQRMEASYPDHHYENVICDAGYESEENYEYLESAGYHSFIKPVNYEQKKRRNYKSWIGRTDNMMYDPDKDEYTCAKGRKLKPIHIMKRRKKRSAYTSEVTVYECENCNRCGYKDNCKKSKGNKRLQVSKKLNAWRAESLRNITSEEGIILRINRSIQVEGAFGMLKEDYGFRRFLTRGKENVAIECFLMCFSYNINKLHNFRKGRGNTQTLYLPKKQIVA